jgi:hypothetical protein
MITKAERTELRSLVRNQIRVLRHEVLQRAKELTADVDVQLERRYANVDKAWADAAFLAEQAVQEANRAVNDAYRTLMGEHHLERRYVDWHPPEKPARERAMLRQTALSRIQAQVTAAMLRLDRQEADLLRDLAIGALESDEAHEFLRAIPTVGELVPAARLAEIEADLGGER